MERRTKKERTLWNRDSTSPPCLDLEKKKKKENEKEKEKKNRELEFSSFPSPDEKSPLLFLLRGGKFRFRGSIRTHPSMVHEFWPCSSFFRVVYRLNVGLEVDVIFFPFDLLINN